MKELNRVKKGGYYYHIAQRGCELFITHDKDDRRTFANDQFALGNYFLTSDDAINAKTKIEKILKGVS